MTDIEVFAQLINGCGQCPVEESYGKGSVLLKEPCCPDSQVRVQGVPLNAIVVRVDSFASPDNVFANSRGECKRADYAIIAEKNSKTVVLYIEMKRTKDSFNDIVKQLTGARCFIHYCAELGKAFWNERDFMRNAEHRFVSIGHTSIGKRTTRIERNGSRNDRPDRALKIDWPHYLQFNQLTGTIS